MILVSSSGFQGLAIGAWRLPGMPPSFRSLEIISTTEYTHTYTRNTVPILRLL